ncbi:MAG: CAF17-like 4Fe-4S cluster assembly/insertion protein YgfZ [Ostreibacterium sp.]
MTQFWAKMPYCSYRFSGKDVRSFLQGQLTQDINSIIDGVCHYAAYCNYKGRMYANLLLHSDGDDIIIRLHQRQAEPVIKRLSMFILRADVNIARMENFHIALNQVAAKQLVNLLDTDLPLDFHCLRRDKLTLSALPLGYYEASLSDELILTTLMKDGSENNDAIQHLRLSGGHFDIVPETSETVLPQQTTLEKWNGISYSKGCYVGQEIIARNKYRGKVNKGLAVSLMDNIDNKVNVQYLDNIYIDNQAVGKVVEFYQGENQITCLALVTLTKANQTCQVGGITTMFSLI